jgi:FtsH-binding integral membrane protein
MFLNYYFTINLDKIDRGGYEYYFSNALSLYLNIVTIIHLIISIMKEEKFWLNKELIGMWISTD